MQFKLTISTGSTRILEVKKVLDGSVSKLTSFVNKH